MNRPSQPRGAALHIQRIEYDPAAWSDTLARYPTAEVYHSPEWLAFLEESKGVTPVLAAVQDGDETVGHFVGAVTRAAGLSVLGSPLSGWGTSTMGFLLQPEVNRRSATETLLDFAFRDLGCVHVELRDRYVTEADAEGLPYAVETRETSDVDLTGSEDDVLSGMQRRTRTYVRRAQRSGLLIEEASGVGFADEYHRQLVDVFASSSLVPTYGVDRVRNLIEIVGPSGQLAMHRVRDAEGNPIASILTVGRGRSSGLWGLAWYRSAAKLHPVEPLQWAAMRYWRERGASVYDLDGITLAKTKFGGGTRTECRLNSSKYPLLHRGRETVRSLFYARQRLIGRLRGRLAEAPSRR